MREFEADRPKMLGFILSCVSAALRNRALVEKAVEDGEIRLPRMADFAEFVEGAFELLELPRGGFSDLVNKDQERVQTDGALGSPIGGAIVSYLVENPSAELGGSAHELLLQLRQHGPENARWPAPNGFKKSVQRIAVGLGALGIGWKLSSRLAMTT